MKALLRVLLILLLIAGLVAGGIYGYSRYTLSQPCEVQPVGNWLLEYSPNQTYLGGSVTSGTSMIVYGDKDKVPLEILVSEGQAVQAGDPLIRYDTTKEDIALDELLLNRQKAYIALEDLYWQYYLTSFRPYDQRTVPTATPWTSPTPQGEGMAHRSEPGLGVTRLSAPVQRDLVPLDNNDGSSPGTPLRYQLEEGQPISARDINALKAKARERMAAVYASFEGLTFGTLDMVVLPTGAVSFTVEGRHGHDQADFNTPLPSSGNGRSIEKALIYAYDAGVEVPSAFIAKLSEQAKRSASYLYVKLRSGFLSTLVVFDSNGDILVIIPSAAEPTPTPSPKPTATPTATPTPTPTPSPTPEDWSEEPVDQPSYGGGGMSWDQRHELMEELSQQIRAAEHQFRQLNFDIEQKTMSNQNGTVVSAIDGVVSKLDPTAKTGETLLEIRGGSGKSVISCMLGETDLSKYPVGSELTGFCYEIGDNVTARVTYVSSMPVTESYSNGGNPNSSGYTMLLEVQGDVELPLYSYVEFTSFEPLSKSGTIYLYEAFVREIDGQDCIFVARDGILKKVQVHTGRRTMEYIELVGSDLTREDYIAFPYDKGVRDGANVKVTDSAW